MTDALNSFCLRLRHAYDITKDEARSAVANIPIVHVNGQLGGCSWLEQKDSRDFKPPQDDSEIATVAARLRLIGDEIDEGPTTQVDELFSKAKAVCFLGFGYHEDNMRWLAARGLNTGNARKLGTSLNLTDAEAGPAKRAGVALEEMDCRALLRKSFLFHAEWEQSAQ